MPSKAQDAACYRTGWMLAPQGPPFGSTLNHPPVVYGKTNPEMRSAEGRDRRAAAGSPLWQLRGRELIACTPMQQPQQQGTDYTSARQERPSRGVSPLPHQSESWYPRRCGCHGHRRVTPLVARARHPKQP